MSKIFCRRLNLRHSSTHFWFFSIFIAVLILVEPAIAACPSGCSFVSLDDRFDVYLSGSQCKCYKVNIPQDGTLSIWLETTIEPASWEIYRNCTKIEWGYENNNFDGKIKEYTVNEGEEYAVNLCNPSSSIGIYELKLSFEPEIDLPDCATGPIPWNGATNRPINQNIDWSDGGGATSFNIYFGTDSTPDSGEYKGNQASGSYNPGTLQYNTTYYWRIDPKNSAGTKTGCNVWSFTTAPPPSYSVTGQVKSRRWPYEPVAGVLVQSDTGENTTTNSNGEYTLNSVPSGSRTITASLTDWWGAGTSNSAIKTINLDSNKTGVNFADFACKATPDVSIDVDDEEVVSGQTFNVTVTIENINYTVSDVKTYLDLSFSSDMVTVGTPSGSGWTSVSSLPVGSPINAVNSSGEWYQKTSTEYLISAYRSGSFSNSLSYSFTVPLTVKQTALPGSSIEFKYRGTIGHSRDPISTGSGTRDQQGLNVNTSLVTIIGTYNVQGQVKSRRWPYEPVAGVLVQSDTGENTTTNANGEYTLNSVPSGSRTITASLTDWWGTGTSNSAIKTINLDSNKTGVNFADFACKATPDVSIYVDNSMPNPGDTINVTVTLKNSNYFVSNVPSYLDLSFEDSKVTIGEVSGTGWDSITKYPVDSVINKVNNSGQWSSINSIEYLISANRVESFEHDGSFSFTVPLTLNEDATGSIILKYRGTIGDNREPFSSGSGTLDQQGLNIYIEEIDIATQTIPPEWGDLNTVESYDIFGSNFRIKQTADGAHILVSEVIDDQDEYVFNESISEAILMYHAFMSYGPDLSYDSDQGLAEKKEYWLNQASNIERTLQGMDFEGEDDLEQSFKFGTAGIIGGILVSTGTGAAIGSVVPGVGTAAGALIGIGVGAVGGGFAYVSLLCNTASDGIGDQYIVDEHVSYIKAIAYLENETSAQETLERFSQMEALANGWEDAGQSFGDISDAVGHVETAASVAMLGVTEIPKAVVGSISNRVFDTSIDWKMDIDSIKLRMDFSRASHLRIMQKLVSDLSNKYENAYQIRNNHSKADTFARLMMEIALANELYLENKAELAWSIKTRAEKWSQYPGKMEAPYEYINSDKITLNNDFNNCNNQYKNFQQSKSTFATEYDNLANIMHSSYDDILPEKNFQVFVKFSNEEGSPEEFIYGTTEETTLTVKNLGENNISNFSMSQVSANGSVLSIGSISDINIGAYQSISFSCPVEYIGDENELERILSAEVRINYTINNVSYERNANLYFEPITPVSVGEILVEKGVIFPTEITNFDVWLYSATSGTATITPTIMYEDIPIKLLSSQQLYLPAEDKQKVSFSWMMPTDVAIGDYGLRFDVAFAGTNFRFYSPKFVHNLPIGPDNMNDFDFNNAAIVTHNNDENIAKRIQAAFNIPNERVLYLEGLTSGQLVPIMERNDLILIGGHEANMLVDQLVYLGKIPGGLWGTPGDASINLVDEPFPPYSAVGSKALVIAGNRLKDTYYAGYGLLYQIHNQVGDINGDYNVDLSDSIVALKILAGMDVTEQVRSDFGTSGADVNNDKRINLQEVFYILHKVAGLR